MKVLNLKKNADFKKVYNSGNSLAAKYLVLYTLENNADANYFGVSVSKKVGKSTLRNLLKRRLKNCYKLLLHKLNIGYDIVFIVRPRAAESTYKELFNEMKYLFKKLKIWNDKI